MVKEKPVFVLYKKLIGLFFGLTTGLFFISTLPCYAIDSNHGQNIQVQLNSISLNPVPGSNNLTLTVEVNSPSNLQPAADIKNTIEKYLDYFMICLTLPNEKFWVNLNPKEPYKMIDSTLSDTDIGGIMLYADLNLKKDICDLMDPQKSAVGKEFWKRLYEKAGGLPATDRAIVMNRFWIAPGESVVKETGQNLTLGRSNLKVYLEQANTDTENKTQDQVQEFSENLLRELILPALNKKINEGDSYKDLRNVYRALILARWFREKLELQQSSTLQNIDYKIIRAAERYFVFKPEQIYREYLKSFRKGQDFIGGNGTNSDIDIMQYFLGGIDFRDIKLSKTEDVNPAAPRGKIRSMYSIDVTIPAGIEKAENPLSLVLNTLKISPVKPDGGTAFAEKILPPVISSSDSFVNFMEERTKSLMTGEKKALSKL